MAELLTGRTPTATAAWRDVFAGIRGEERLLWYPSAGHDFRDILEMHAERRAINGVTEVPHLYLHTDYDAAVMPAPGALAADTLNRTQVDIVESHELKFEAGVVVNYTVSDQYASNPERATPNPLVRLLRVRVRSARLGESLAWVLYAAFETFNFLTEVLLKHRIRVTHLVKVRDGSAMGGGKRCASTLYPFLGELGVRHLLADDHVDPNRRFVEEISGRRGSEGPRPAFALQRRSESFKWSDLDVKSFAVVRRDGRMTSEDLDALWRSVGQP
jgi:hypothetical protein